MATWLSSASRLVSLKASHQLLRMVASAGCATCQMLVSISLVPEFSLNCAGVSTAGRLYRGARLHPAQTASVATKRIFAKCARTEFIGRLLPGTQMEWAEEHAPACEEMPTRG